MSTFAQTLQFLIAAGFVGLGLRASATWAKYRDPVRARLAVAIGSLGLVAVLGGLRTLAGSPAPLLSVLSILVFLASGYALLVFRHAVVPLSRRARIGAGVAVALAAVVATAGGPLGAGVGGSTGRLVAATLLIGTWVACVVEPIYRFWVVSRGTLPVQRRRLRAISVGYAGIVAVLIPGLFSQAVDLPAGADIVRQLATLALVPILYVSLSTPPFVRRLWRAGEEAALQRAMDDLMVFSEDREELAHRGLHWARRLVGAEGGFVRDPGGVLLCASGVDEETVRRIVKDVDGGAPEDSAVVDLGADAGGIAIVVPLRTGSGDGWIGVLSGRFTLLFGSEEVERLRSLATPLAAALERAHLSAEVREQKEFAEQVIESSMDGILAFDREYRYTIWNRGMERISGMSKEDVLGRVAFDVFPFLAESGEDEYFREALGGREVIAEDRRYAVPETGRDGYFEGRYMPMRDPQGHVTGGLAQIRDVTARKLAGDREQRRAAELGAFAEAAERLTGILEAEALLPAIADEARYVVGCRYAALGVLSEEGELEHFIPSGMTDDEIASIDHWPRGEGLLGALIDAEGSIRVDDMSVDPRSSGFPEGHPPMGSFLGVPVRGADRTVGLLYLTEKIGESTFDDVDEAVAVSFATFAGEAIRTARAFERERELVSELQGLNEMKDAFLTAVSHELRTPLTAVVGFAHTLLEAGRDLPADRHEEFLDRLIANAERLDELLGDLLDVDRLTRGILAVERRPADLGQVAMRTVERAGLLAEHRLSVETESVVVPVDVPKVERCLENLLSNAQRYTPAGTDVWVRARPVVGGALLIVEDAGPGVPDGQKELIFEAFRQGPGTVEHAPGVGIGLSLVARFVALHGGRAWVEDRRGGGASFRLFFPEGTDDEPAEELEVGTAEDAAPPVPHGGVGGCPGRVSARHSDGGGDHHG